MSLANNFRHFFIPESFKITRPGHQLKPLESNRCPKNINLCPVALVKTYVAATADLLAREPVATAQESNPRYLDTLV